MPLSSSSRKRERCSSQVGILECVSKVLPGDAGELKHLCILDGVIFLCYHFDKEVFPVVCVRFIV